MAYLVLEASGITDQWILDYVVPNMARAGISRQVCLVLGRAILWRMFDPSGDELIPEEQRSRVMARYADLGSDNLLAPGTNPVRKVTLVVDGYDAEVLIDQVVGGEEDGAVRTIADPDVRQRLGMRNQEIRLLASQGALLLLLSFYFVILCL